MLQITYNFEVSQRGRPGRPTWFKKQGYPSVIHITTTSTTQLKDSRDPPAPALICVSVCSCGGAQVIEFVTDRGIPGILPLAGIPLSTSELLNYYRLLVLVLPWIFGFLGSRLSLENCKLTVRHDQPSALARPPNCDTQPTYAHMRLEVLLTWQDTLCTSTRKLGSGLRGSFPLDLSRHGYLILNAVTPR